MRTCAPRLCTRVLAVPPTGPADASRELTELRQRIGEAIRAARLAKGWNQDQLGEALHRDRFVVGRWEKGRADIKVEDAIRLAEALGHAGIVALVEERDAAGESQAGATRDLAIGRMLRRPRIRQLQVVLADDLDVAA